jgi:hypothetical protein
MLFSCAAPERRNAVSRSPQNTTTLYPQADLPSTRHRYPSALYRERIRQSSPLLDHNFMEFTTMDVTTLNPTGAMDPRYVIRENDVLFGRGNHTKNHPGNIYYRSLVSSVKDIYSNYRKERKQVISELIYDCIKSLNPPGLFVHEVQSDRWEEVNKQGALRKISQALREKKCLTPTEHSLDRKQAKEEEQIQWMKVRRPIPTLDGSSRMVNTHIMGLFYIVDYAGASGAEKSETTSYFYKCLMETKNESKSFFHRRFQSCYTTLFYKGLVHYRFFPPGAVCGVVGFTTVESPFHSSFTLSPE